MTPTTKYGTIGKWSALVAGISMVVAQTLPEAGNYAGLAGILAVALGQWANGEGNVQSKTGGPKE